MLLLKSIPKINDVGGKLVKVDILHVGATIKHCFIFIKVKINIFYFKLVHTKLNRIN